MKLDWKAKAALPLFLIHMLAAALLVGQAVPLDVRAATDGKVTQESIDAKEKEIDQAKEDIKGLKSGLSDVKKIKEELEREKSDLKSYVSKLDENLAQIEGDIRRLENEIAVKEADLLLSSSELEQAERKVQEQYDLTKTSIRFMYEAEKKSSVWELLLSAGGFGELLNRVDYINSVYEYDRNLWEEYLLNRNYVQLCKEQLEVERDYLEEQKQAVEEQQAQVEELIEAKRDQIVAYETDISNKEQAIREYEQEIDDQNALIAELERLVEEEKERLRQQNAAVVTYDGGMFKFPLADYTRVSDDYGERIHPTLGVLQFHNGVDLAAPKGTAIYAAYDGVVVAASYSSSMGNYVMINHGDGLYTIYMHASALYVSADQSVKRGDAIAAVGATGRATGNHLHFGVRKDGAYVSPWNYLSK